jgi:hypothetical protein
MTLVPRPADMVSRVMELNGLIAAFIKDHATDFTGPAVGSS